MGYKAAINPTTEKGCSIFGHNNFTIGIFDQIPSQFRDKFKPTLKITSGSLEKQEICDWDTNQIICKCPQIYDGNLNLPQVFPYSLSFDDSKYFTPSLSAINYHKLGKIFFFCSLTHILLYRWLCC